MRTRFPPDDRSVGYERGTSISKAWDQATTDEAIEVASHVAAHLDELAGAREGASDRTSRCRDFCRHFAERAFRRPLTDEQLEFFVTRHFTYGLASELAVKRVVLLVLKSPRFLYRESGHERDAYDVASRLSFGLWDSLPDRQLLEAAAAGQLATPEQVAGQAERMLTDPRTRSKVREFLLQWLKVDQVPDVSKDPVRFPEFTPEMRVRLAHVAGLVSGRRGVERRLRLSPVAAGGLALSQRSAGKVLWRRSARGRTVPEGHVRSQMSGPEC